jgi:anthranilate synthase component 1
MDSIIITGDHEMMHFNAIIGYSGYNSVQYFEQVKLDNAKHVDKIPELRYEFYRNMIVVDHFHDIMYIIDNTPEGSQSNIAEIKEAITIPFSPTLAFKTVGEEYSNMSDEDFKEMVTKGKYHCQRGDVFQIVLSRKYYTPFEGDEINLFRALRSVNPSPYLFFFDYDDYKIFGSSPEAQLVIKEGRAEIHPIAGTFRRTGNKIGDAALAEKLSNDPKEISEHVMLVDLARNDLSRNTEKVTVEKYKEIQYFSHVIHLVSKVTGQLRHDSKNYQIFGDTFPAGTLSGAPKIKAMQLIDKYEPEGRSFYGGGIGLIHFNGDLNHAIIIRSFLSYDGVLTRQAGAGVVIKSVEENELQEVNNKLAALKNAIILAEKI